MSMLLIPILISITFLLRTGLILIGLFKGPILHTFEKYGDDETVYYPLPSLLLWAGVLVISGTGLMSEKTGINLNSGIIGVLLMIGAYLAYTNPDIARQYPQIFMIYPRWYYELRDRTTRYERRRIAYMWLWLPRRLRVIYNASDRAFSQWADLVIMATMRYDEDPATWPGATTQEQYDY